MALAFLPCGSAAAETILVRSGGDLQAALNAARPGDTLLLEAGTTFSGNFVLPVKSGNQFITVRTEGTADAFPGEGKRISPADAPRLAKIRSSNTMPALRTAPGAHHWRLQLLEFPANREGYSEIIQLGDGSSAQYQLSQVPYALELDRLYIHGDPVMGQKRGVALNAADVTIRNCHISDIRGYGMDTQAIGGWNGPGPFLIENNYLEAAGENVILGGADPSIPNLVSANVTVRGNLISRPMSWRDPIVPTPTGVSARVQGSGSLGRGVHTYRIVARRRVASGAIAQSAASVEVAADAGPKGAIVVTWTAIPDVFEYYVYGRSPLGVSQYWKVSTAAFTDTGAAGTPGVAPTGSGSTWTVKNLFELKNARNVVIEHNVFENNWAGGQSGYAIVLTPRNQDGKCTWCVVENVTFQHNVVRNSAGGVNILGYDDLAPSRQTRGIRITHNLFVLTKNLGGTGWFLQLGNGPADIVVDHNTIDADGTTISYVYGGTATTPMVIPGFRFTNNAARHGDYGLNGAEVGFGNEIIRRFFPDGIVQGNWLQGGYASRYPAGNYFDGTYDSAFVNLGAGDYTPAGNGPLARRATDGTDIGADVAALTPALSGAISGTIKPRPRPPTNLRIVTR